MSSSVSLKTPAGAAVAQGRAATGRGQAAAAGPRGTSRSLVSSLTFRLIAAVVLIELAVLSVLGLYSFNAFNDEISRKTMRNLEVAGQLLSQGRISYDIVANTAQLSALLKEEVRSAMVVGINGNVFHASRPEYVGRRVSELPNIEPDWFSASTREPRIVGTLEDTGRGIASVYPIFTVDAAVPYLFSYISVATTESDNERRQLLATFLLTSLIGVGVTSTAIGLFLNAAVTGWLRRAMPALGRIGAGDFTTRLGGRPAARELTALWDGVNGMAAGIEQRDRALRDSETRYAIAADGANDGIWDWDVKTDRVFFSSRWKTMVGCDVTWPLDQLEDWLDRIAVEDRDAVWRELHAHVSGATDRFQATYRIEMPDGSRRWMQARGIAARDADGQATRVAGSQSDITEFRRAQAELAEHRNHLENLVEQRTIELREADDRLRSAFNAATEAFAVFDRQGRRLLANAGFDALFPDIAAAGTDALRAFSQAALGRTSSAEALVAELTRPPGAEKEIHLPNGTWIRITTRMTANGDIVLCAADVSVYKNAAVAAETALERQKELNRLQRGFVSMVSHQFRTPLSIIDVAAQRLVTRGGLAGQAEVDERVLRIRRAVQRMTGLIESTLSLASLDAGMLPFRPAPCNLAALVAEIAERQTEVSPTHVINVDVAWLPETVRCDANLVEQVIVNLLSNAVKYSPNTSRVDIKGWTDGTFAALSVRDYGVGIEEGDLPHVFDRFFRGKTAVGIPGTGIGLSVAQHLVSLHNGSVSVISKPGQGSTFVVRLPIAGDAVAAA